MPRAMCGDSWVGKARIYLGGKLFGSYTSFEDLSAGLAAMHEKLAKMGLR